MHAWGTYVQQEDSPKMDGRHSQRPYRRNVCRTPPGKPGAPLDGVSQTTKSCLPCFEQHWNPGACLRSPPDTFSKWQQVTNSYRLHYLWRFDFWLLADLQASSILQNPDFLRLPPLFGNYVTHSGWQQHLPHRSTRSTKGLMAKFPRNQPPCSSFDCPQPKHTRQLTKEGTGRTLKEPC